MTNMRGGGTNHLDTHLHPLPRHIYSFCRLLCALIVYLYTTGPVVFLPVHMMVSAYSYDGKAYEVVSYTQSVMQMIPPMNKHHNPSNKDCVLMF